MHIGYLYLDGNKIYFEKGERKGLNFVISLNFWENSKEMSIRKDVSVNRIIFLQTVIFTRLLRFTANVDVCSFNVWANKIWKRSNAQIHTCT